MGRTRSGWQPSRAVDGCNDASDLQTNLSRDRRLAILPNRRKEVFDQRSMKVRMRWMRRLVHAVRRDDAEKAAVELVDVRGAFGAEDRQAVAALGCGVGHRYDGLCAAPEVEMCRARIFDVAILKRTFAVNPRARSIGPSRSSSTSIR